MLPTDLRMGSGTKSLYTPEMGPRIHCRKNSLNSKMPRFMGSRGSFTSFSASASGFAWANSTPAHSTDANSTGTNASGSGGPHSAADETTAPPMAMATTRTPMTKIL